VKQRIKTMTMQVRQARAAREEHVLNGKKPTLIAYSVKDGRGEEAKAIWTRIGAARKWARLFDPPRCVVPFAAGVQPDLAHSRASYRSF
jgi:hypothetical protein